MADLCGRCPALEHRGLILAPAQRAPPLHIHVPSFPRALPPWLFPVPQGLQWYPQPLSPPAPSFPPGPPPSPQVPRPDPPCPSEALWSSSPGCPLLGEGPQLCSLGSEPNACSQPQAHPGPQDEKAGFRRERQALRASRRWPPPLAITAPRPRLPSAPAVNSAVRPWAVPPLLRGPEQALSKLSAHTGAAVRTRTQEPGPAPPRVEASALGGHPHRPSLVLAHGLSGSSPAPAPRGPSPGLPMTLVSSGPGFQSCRPPSDSLKGRPLHPPPRQPSPPGPESPRGRDDGRGPWLSHRWPPQATLQDPGAPLPRGQRGGLLYCGRPWPVALSVPESPAACLACSWQPTPRPLAVMSTPAVLRGSRPEDAPGGGLRRVRGLGLRGQVRVWRRPDRLGAKTGP